MVVDEASDPGPIPKRVDLSIGGMTCASCVSMIESVLSTEEGILSVSINLLTSSGVVEFVAPATPQTVVSAIEDVCGLKCAFFYLT